MKRCIALSCLLLLALAAPAAARETVVRSFDGTELHVSFFPAKAGKRAPTILMTHGWAGRRDRSPNPALHDAGFNVLTWDSRGFGDSGGTVTIDYRYRILRRRKVPVKMLWFCGGHGTCLTGTGTAGHMERRAVAWLQRYVMRRKKVKTGPRFEWLADDAVWRSARSFPPPAGTPVVGQGSGTLAVSPLDALSGSPTAAGPASNAVDIAIPEATAQVVGRPRLRLTYSGTGTATHVFAQIVDESRNVVLGNQVTPIPVRLDGATRTITRSLEGVAASLAPGRRYRLQLIGGTPVYGPARGAAMMTFSAARIALPTTSP